MVRGKGETAIAALKTLGIAPDFARTKPAAVARNLFISVFG
jgi:hypothetical protein